MKKLKELFVNSFFYYLAIGLAEEVLEDFIAYEISTVILKGLSTFLTISASYGCKILLKYVVKKITYKEGNDKMEKLKSFFSWLKSNKKTLSGWFTALASSVTAVLGGTGVIDVESIAPLYISEFNVTPVIYFGVLFIVTIIGVKGKGLETTAEYNARKDVEAEERALKEVNEKAQKEANAVIKEAKAKIKLDKKNAKKQAKADEKAKLKEAEDEAKAKHDAEVQKVVQELLATEKNEELKSNVNKVNNTNNISVAKEV